MVLPIVGQTFVEVGVVLFADIFGFSHPDGFSLVQFLQISADFFDFFLLFLFFIVFFNLDVSFLFLLFLFIIGNLFFSGLFDLKINWE